MRAYRAIASARFRELLQYRAAALAGVGTQVFWGFIKIMVLDAFYRGASGTQPMTLAQVVTYVWLGQALLAMLPWNVDRELAEKIRKGDVAFDLLRPMDLYGHWFMRTLALRTAPTLMRSGPIFLFAGVAMALMGQQRWAMMPPESAQALGLWLLSLLVALVLGVAMTVLWSVSMMWTISGEGATHLAPAIVVIFSGMVVPLPLLPDAVALVIEWLPFAGLFDLPSRIYMGHIQGAEAWGVLARQAVWAAIFVGLGRFFVARGARQLVLQGG